MDNCCCCNSFIADFEKIILLDISLKIFKIDQYKGFVFINNVADFFFRIYSCICYIFGSISFPRTLHTMHKFIAFGF